ncbi:MAG: hypothetical protein ACSHX0_13500 [Akkermansiaceae bacterium]
MRRPKIGSVVEVPTELGFFYGLVTHRHDWGDVVRFFKDSFKTPLSSFELFEDESKLITKQCIFSGKLEEGGEVQVVGKSVVPKELLSFPLFRGGTPHHETKKVNVWFIWDGENEWEVGDLTEDQKLLPRLGALDNEAVVIHLEGRTHPSLL